MIFVNFDKYGVLNHIEYNDEVIFKGNNNVNKVFVCFDGIELKPQHYLTYSALINDKDYSGNLTDLASVRTTYNGKDGYMFSIFSNLTKDAGTLKLSVRLVDRLTDAILVSGILPLIVQDSAISTYSNVNITTTQYQALLTAFDDLSQTFNETNFKTINEESLFGEGNITLPTIEYVDSLDANLREFVNDNITNLGYADETLRNQINEQNKVIEKQNRRIKVLELASEGNTLNTTTEDAIGYEVNATSNILPFAEINKIGGMSYKSDNLLNPNSFKSYNATLLNDEFTITLETTDFYLSGEFNEKAENVFLTLTAGNYQLLSTNPNVKITFYGNTNLDSASSSITTLSSASKYWGIRVRSINGTSLNGQKFKIAIYKTDSIRSDYQPYFDGLRNSAVNQVVVKGANLLGYDDIPQTTTNGITYKVENGVFYYSGTATARVDINVNLSKPLELNGEYKLAFFNNQSGGTMRLFGGSELLNSLPISYANRTDSLNYSNNSLTQLSFMISAGTSVANAELKPMLVKDSTTPTTYKPYKETTYTIPTTITSIDGYDIGIDGTYHNYVDFANRKFVEHNKKIIFDGTQNIVFLSLNENYVEFKYEQNEGFNPAPDSSGGLHIITNFTTQTTNDRIAVGSKTIYWRIPTHKQNLTGTTAESLKAYLTNNPVEIIYSLANPIKTDLSYRITDDFIIEIEGSGTIIFDNEYKQAIPYSWTYQEKL